MDLRDYLKDLNSRERKVLFELIEEVDTELRLSSATRKAINKKNFQTSPKRLFLFLFIPKDLNMI